MAEKLTPQQQMAVDDRGGRLLVSAAAGSGKTKVLIDRLMGYLTDPVDPANIDDFLLITYTKAAASELRGKIAEKLAERVALDPENRHLQRQQQRLYLAKISTVHAFCADILRENAYRLDLSSDFRVADEQECDRIREAVMEKVLRDAYEHADENPDFCYFVDSQGVGRNDRLVPELVMQVYDSARCHLDPKRWLAHCLTQTTTEGITDASENYYGMFLIKQLHSWLDLQIIALQRCAALSIQETGLDKVHNLLQETIGQLITLRKCEKWDDIIRYQAIDFGRLVFPKNFENDALKEQIKAVREACKKGLEKRLKPFADDSKQVLADLRASAAAQRGLIYLVDAFGNTFEHAKRNRRILDFGDLEHRTLDLLLGKSRTTPTVAAREIAERFREVMVDEYQDSNAVQDAIYAALTDFNKNLFMVGDVKQSIYQFRLADPSIFLQKYNSFTAAEQAKPGEDRKVLLSRNFRSSGGVLSGCNDVFAACMCPEVGGLYYGPDEALYEGIPHIPLLEAEVELCCVDVQEHTYPEEAAYVADRIRTMLDGKHFVRDGEGLRPIVPEDIVILLRSPGSAGSYYEKALSDLGIRYTTGGGLDLLKTDEVSALRSCLQCIYNPRQDIPLIAALASPIFCFSADELASIRSCKRTGDFLDAMRSHGGEKTLWFLDLLQKLRNIAHREPLTVLLEQLFRVSHLESVYGIMENGRQRTANIQSFYQLAAAFEAGGNRDLGRFLEYLDALEIKGMVAPGEASAQGCVTIMSIHKSKGLEFPVVFLCGLGREFNMEGQHAPILCHKFMGIGLMASDSAKRIRYPTIAKRAIACKIGEETLSEELRVLYVAMTRARDRLIMTYASSRLQKDLTELTQRLSMGDKDLLVREAVCPGEWVLITALQKTEAGALFALGGYPGETSISENPWMISVVCAPTLCATKAHKGEDEPIPVDVKERIRENLMFRYAHSAAVTAPSKMTATQRKGRLKDEEASEGAILSYSFLQRHRAGSITAGGKDRGNAMHAVMQYINYEACTDFEGVSREIHRLAEQKFISVDQANMAEPEKIAAFFATDMGQKLRNGQVVREFKFSILEDGSSYDASLIGEKVLLQGVVDCALIEDDGITILDFKTDHVTKETLPIKAERYTPQITAYADALQRIYQKPIKKAMLYFFHINQFVEI